MSNKVTTPYPLFSDIDGTPLDAGFVFIGESNKDPEANPIPLFWDKEQTQPAVQPIRTRNGYFVNNDVKAQLFSGSLKCSMRVKNRNTTPVYEALTLLMGSTASSVEDASGKSQQEINNSLVGIAYAPDLPESRIRILAGTVRNTGDGWKWIFDANHTSAGFAPEITVDGVNLVINYGFTAKRVLTLVATADETFSALGMQIGGSVANAFTNLQIKAPVAFTVNTQTGEVTAPSYHVNTINTVVTAGKCVVNHPSDGMTGSAPVVSRIGTATPNHTDVLMTYGAAQTIFNGAGELDGYISYDGANWVYSGNLLTPPTMTWVSSAGDGYLEVSHLETDPFNIKIEERDVPVKIKTLSVASNLFRLRFYDNTNTKIITPTTDMQFYFSRKAMVPKNVLRGVHAVRRGYGGILPADLVSATGNIWIFGVMEV